jgi:lactoylglutathione lyase
MKCVCLLLGLGIAAAAVERPAITGLAHVVYYAADPSASGPFYAGLLGLAPARTKLHGQAVTYRIGERHAVGLLPEREAGSDRLHHIAFQTSDAVRMREYLVERGRKVGDVKDGCVTAVDPDGHAVEFCDRPPPAALAAPNAVSRRLLHTGTIVNALEPAMRFYRDELGFRETWRGSSNEKVLSWINLQVPEGTDYIEFMLHDPVPPPGRRGTAHHICLELDNVPGAVETLKARAAKTGYTRPIEARVGRNRRNLSNLFDPDGTRTEIMEPRTVDGTPTPSSTAPPPK